MSHAWGYAPNNGETCDRLLLTAVFDIAHAVTVNGLF